MSVGATKPAAHHGIGGPSEVDGNKPDKRKFKTSPIGYLHIDIAEVMTEQGNFTCSPRPTARRLALVERDKKGTTRVSGDCLRHLIEALPKDC